MKRQKYHPRWISTLFLLHEFIRTTTDVFVLRGSGRECRYDMEPEASVHERVRWSVAPELNKSTSQGSPVCNTPKFMHRGEYNPVQSTHVASCTTQRHVQQEKNVTNYSARPTISSELPLEKVKHCTKPPAGHSSSNIKSTRRLISITHSNPYSKILRLQNTFLIADGILGGTGQWHPVCITSWNAVYTLWSAYL
jgi:hypothetical protein